MEEIILLLFNGIDLEKHPTYSKKKNLRNNLRTLRNFEKTLRKLKNLINNLRKRVSGICIAI